MSELVLHGPDFRMNKKDAFASVPNLRPETIRKHVAAAGRLGFIDTVKSKGVVYLRLTAEGAKSNRNDSDALGGGVRKSSATIFYRRLRKEEVCQCEFDQPRVFHPRAVCLRQQRRIV
jgi:hypothetical protein